MPFAGEHLGFFFVGVDLQVHVHVLALGDRFEDAADRGGAEAVAANQQGDIGLPQDELEPQAFRAQLGDLELRFRREFDELDGDVLEKIPDLVGDHLHEGMMAQKKLRARFEAGDGMNMRRQRPGLRGVAALEDDAAGEQDRAFRGRGRRAACSA